MGPSPLNQSGNGQISPVTFRSGRIAAIAVDPSDINHWLLGVGNGGIWESRDVGGHWRPIADDAPTKTIGALAFAASDPNIIYAGTGEATGPGFTKAGMGMLKSTDGGKTWSLLGASSLARAAVRRIRVHPADPKIVLATLSRGGFGRDAQTGLPLSPPFGVLRSTDGGANWLRVLAGTATALEVDEADFNNQYAAIGEGGGPAVTSKDSAGSAVNGVY